MSKPRRRPQQKPGGSAKGDATQDPSSDAPLELERVQEVLEAELGAEAAQVVTHRLMMSYSGPLPPAEHLRGYDAIIPSGGDRIMVMAEKEQAHRHELDGRHMHIAERESAADVSIARTGQWMMFAILMVLVLGGVAAMLLEKYQAAYGTFGAALAAALVNALVVKLLQRNNGPSDQAPPAPKKK